MEITNPSCPRCGSLYFAGTCSDKGNAPALLKCESCGHTFTLAKAVPMVIGEDG